MAKRSTTPDRLAHAIADDLAYSGLHGKFSLSGYHQTYEIGGRVEYHVYEAVFNPSYSLGLEEVPALADTFRFWLNGRYRGNTQVQLLVVFETIDGQALEDRNKNWRSLTRVGNLDGAFEQVGDKLVDWQGREASAKYLAVKGILILVEAGRNYQNGRLY